MLVCNRSCPPIIAGYFHSETFDRVPVVGDLHSKVGANPNSGIKKVQAPQRGAIATRVNINIDMALNGRMFKFKCCNLSAH
jgi:hypothetical protein